VAKTIGCHFRDHLLLAFWAEVLQVQEPPMEAEAASEEEVAVVVLSMVARLPMCH